MRLIDLAAVCRSTGLVVHEVDGWLQRSRRSNTQEYPPGGPKAVMCHHTASPPHTDGQRDVDYICYGSPVKPVANLYLSRKAEVWVCAAGPTNTNGAGHDWWGGGVPDNSMNSYAIGIEAANNGVGEPWPWTQQAAYVKLVAALCRAYKIPVNSVRAHHEWTTRKVDPAGQSQYATGSAKWDMDLFRTDVANALYPPPPVTPPIEEDDMTYLFKLPNGDYGLRGPTGSRRVSGEEFGQTVPPREEARQVVAGSNEEYWIMKELAAYDRALGV